MKPTVLENKILDYIKNPQYQNIINYAIVIKGKWGSGKTYFINKILRERFDNNIYRVYVSLYGLSTINELELAIKSAFIPLVDNKLIKFVKDNNSTAFNILKELDNSKIKDSTLLISKEMISFLWKIGIDAIQLYKEHDDKKIIFVIDDLERCNIPITNVFGYFSNVLTSNYILFDKENHIIKNYNKNRVIFVLNEEELKNNLEDYKNTKEKLIGMEYELEPEIDLILTEYKYNIEDNNKEITSDLINSTIKNVCERLSFFNLRMVKYTQQYVNTILIELQKDNKKIDKSYVNNFVQYITLIMIQKVQGTISKKDDIYDSIKTYHSSRNLVTSMDKIKKEEPFKSKWVALYDLLYDIVFNGTVDKEKIQKDYDNWTEININQKSFSYLCSNYEYMDDTNFKEYFDKFNKLFENNKMLKMTELFDFYQLNYDLIEKNILNLTKNKLDKKFQDYFTKNESKLDFENFHFDYDDIMLIDREFREEHNNKSIPKLMDKMIDMSMQYYAPNHYFENFVNAYKDNNLEQMVKYIENVNPDYEEYTLAILSKLDINEFFTYLIKFNTREQLRIFDSFKKRYNQIIYYNNNSHLGDFIDAYLDDIVYLQKLAKFYNNPSFSNIMSPVNYMRKQIALKYEALCNLKYK